MEGDAQAQVYRRRTTSTATKKQPILHKRFVARMSDRYKGPGDDGGFVVVQRATVVLDDD